MPEQVEKTRRELEDQITKEVQLHAHCEGFRSIGVHPLKGGQIPRVNWHVDGINYGDADEASCDVALSEIIPRMQRQYRYR